LRGGRSTGTFRRTLTRVRFLSALSARAASGVDDDDEEEGGEGARGGSPGAMITVLCSSSGDATGDLPKNEREGADSSGSKSGAGMVGARSWAGAVVAHSRSGLGAGGIRVVLATRGSPQLLQKFAPSRFSVLQTGQNKAMAYLLTTLGNPKRKLAAAASAGWHGLLHLGVC
jgi:hypothetical protein